MRVELVHVDPDLFGDRQHLCCECLVELDDVHVTDRHSGAVECLLDCTDRSNAHQLGLVAPGGGRDVAGARLEAELRCLLSTHHKRCGRAVVQRARVACRDGAALAERRGQRRQLLNRRARTRAVVLADHGAVFERDRDDLAVEEAALLSSNGALLRTLGVCVLVLTRHAVLLGHVLGGEAHRDVCVRLAVVALQRRVLRVGVGGLLSGGVLGDELNATGDEDVADAGLHVVGSDADGIETGSAVAADGRPVGLLAELVRQQRRDAADVVGLHSLRQAAACDYLFDLRRVDTLVASQ